MLGTCHRYVTVTAEQTLCASVPGQNNHHEENISSKMKGLNGKVSDLERAAAQRKAKLDENSAFLQFNWKADVVESWIGE